MCATPTLPCEGLAASCASFVVLRWCPRETRSRGINPADGRRHRLADECRRMRFSSSALLMPQRFSSALRSPSFLLPRPSFTPLALALARINALHDHGAFELGEDATHLKHRPARWGGRVDRLLVQIQVTTCTAWNSVTPSGRHGSDQTCLKVVEPSVLGARRQYPAPSIVWISG